jgi:hypothetical protein
MKTVLLFLSICFTSIVCFSQDLTHEGKEFWIAFPESFTASQTNYKLDIMSFGAAKGTVSVVGGFSTEFSVGPGRIETIRIPAGDVYNFQSETISAKAVHVQSDYPIVVFASMFQTHHSASTICLPETSQGKEYMITTYASVATSVISAQSQFVISGGSDTVTVEITPSCKTAGGGTARIPIYQRIKPGESFLVKAERNPYGIRDLTGTTVRIVKGKGRVSVYNGHKKINLTAGKGLCKSGDPLLETAHPIAAWGTEYIAIMTKGQNLNMYRVVSLENGCDVFQDGKLIATIDAGDSYDGILKNEATLIRTSDRAAVFQSMISTDCTQEEIGDPSIVILSANQQMKLKRMVFCPQTFNGIDRHYLTIVTRSGDTENIFLNKQLLTDFSPIPADDGYSYTIIGIDSGAYELSTEGEGFIAYIHGLADADSYYHSVGLVVNPLTAEQLKPSTD